MIEALRLCDLALLGFISILILHVASISFFFLSFFVLVLFRPLYGIPRQVRKPVRGCVGAAYFYVTFLDPSPVDVGSADSKKRGCQVATVTVECQCHFAPADQPPLSRSCPTCIPSTND